MAEKFEVSPFKVKYKDVFHMKNLYVMMHEYLIEEGFLDEEQKQNASEGHQTAEVMYLSKRIQKGLHQGGEEIWCWWRLYKKPHSKYSSFFRFDLEFDFHVVYLSEMEVMHQGKKMKINKGEIEFDIRPVLVADYDGKWAEHWLLKYFLTIYLHRIMHFEIERKLKELWREAYKFQHMLKRFFALRLFVPTPEPFWRPIYGYEGQP